MRRLLLALAIVIGSSHVAAAEAPRPPAKRKHVSDAYLVSLGATIGPTVAFALMAGDDPKGTFGTIGGVLATSAIVLGPSAGHWYVGNGWTTGLTLRLGGVAIIGGLVLRDQFVPTDVGTMIVGGLAAVALWQTGVIWDVVTLPSAVRRYNRKHAPVAVLPLVTDRSAGLAIAGAF